MDPARFHITYHLNNENGEALFSFSHVDTELIKGKNKLNFFFPPFCQ
jgi:lipopolysaccharide transport system ATP-binding protein